MLIFFRSFVVQWPHNIGPMITYLASCGDTTCDKFSGSDAKWFKIDQVGKEENSDTWVVKDTLCESGRVYVVVCGVD